MADNRPHAYDAAMTEAISKNFKKNQSVISFNCDKQGHLKRDCRQDVPRNNDYSRGSPNRRP